MKEKILMAICCTALLSITSAGYSAEGPYVSGNLGLAMPSDSDVNNSGLPGLTVVVESDMGLALGVAAGYGFGNNIRIEGEVVWQKNDVDKASLLGIELDFTGDTSSLALLLNGYYDFVNESAFTPFISAGLGYARVELNDIGVVGGDDPFSVDDKVLAYQIGAGVAYAANEKVSVDVKYRYLGTSDLEYGTEVFTETMEYSSHNVYAGIRVAF